MEYRREIDGLRALAVLPVILFHAGFQSFSGGFIGVDIFFVISGYLITSIIITEKKEETFNLINFYERRVRRIFPALYVVMIVSLPFAWLLMSPHQLKEFSESLVAVSLFTSNVLFWKQSDYFDAEASLKPLLHTWSLGIEEQYYLLFPILIILAWKAGKGKILILLFVIASISLYLAQTLSTQQPAANFYLLPTRAWELLIGSFLAFGFTKIRNSNINPSFNQLFSFAGLLAILMSIFFLDTKTPWPSLYTLPSTLGAACIILFASKQTYVGAALASRLLVGIGLISYSIYLWHQPILAFIKIFNRSNELTVFQHVIYFFLTFLLAFLTFKLIETPFRRGLLKSRILFLSALFISITFIFIGYQGHQTNGFMEVKLSEVPIEKRSILIDVTLERRAAERLFIAHSSHLSKPLFDYLSSNRKVLFIGDSQARDLSAALVEHSSLFSNYQFRLLSLPTKCLYTTAQFDKACIDGSGMISTSGLLKEADLIVVSFLWKEDINLNMLSELLSSVKKENSAIILLGAAGFIDMASLTYDLTKVNKAFTQDELDRIVFDSRRLKFDRGNLVVEKLAQELNIKYFDRKDLYCNYTLSQCRMISLEDGGLLWDNVHLSRYGMKVTAEKIEKIGLLERKNN